MAHVEINTQKYGRLLAKALPRAIATEAENRRALEQVDQLLSKGEDKLTAEEGALLDLLVTLIEKFEEENYPIPKASPNEALKFLIEQRGLKQSDMLPIFNSSGIISEVLSGKRSISKAQAKRLAEFFHVSVELFI